MRSLDRAGVAGRHTISTAGAIIHNKSGSLGCFWETKTGAERVCMSDGQVLAERSRRRPSRIDDDDGELSY